MRPLEDLLAPTDILLISDEVYEHMVFDGAEHRSAARFAGPGRTRLHRVQLWQDLPRHGLEGGHRGSACSPDGRIPQGAPVQRVHRQRPMQHGLAAYLQDPTPYLQLPAFYQAKRDLFRQGLEGSRLKLLPSTGSYFQCVDISAVSDLNESDFCQWLTREVGVAAIPLSAFYGDGFDQRVVRFCFAKKDETLRAALERLRKL